MPTRRPQMAERILEDLPGSPDIADITYGYDEIGFKYPADDSPFDSFKLKTEIGDLRDEVFAFDPGPDSRRRLCR